jgi:hypothetical protein
MFESVKGVSEPSVETAIARQQTRAAALGELVHPPPRHFRVAGHGERADGSRNGAFQRAVADRLARSV